MPNRPVLPEKVSCPIPAACSGVGTLPAASGHFVSKSGSLRCFPSRGIPFRTVILFSRCRPSMNYPKSTRKKCNSRNIARIAFWWSLHFGYCIFAIILYNGSMRRRCVSMALPGTPGQRISDLCNGNHITQKELAEKIGVSASQLSRIVSGETRTSLNKSSCLKKPVFMRVSAISISLLITNW